ncbi:MAG: hypothetical protein ACREMY_29360 [bacterium]
MYLMIRRRELLLLVPILLGALVLFTGRWAARWSDDQVLAYNAALSTYNSGDLDTAQTQLQSSLEIYQSSDPIGDALNPPADLEAAARTYEALGMTAANLQDAQGALEDFKSCIAIVGNAQHKGSLSQADATSVDLIAMECRYNFEVIATGKSAPSLPQPGNGNGNGDQGNQQAPAPAPGDLPSLGTGSSTGSGL